MVKVCHPGPHRSSGFTMLEILVTLVILMLGLLGLVGLQARATSASMEAYQRAQALILVNHMVDVIRANRRVGPCFNFTDEAAGTPFIGTAETGYGMPAPCTSSTAAENQSAMDALDSWDALLQGAAESNAAGSVGAMLGARGCISYAAGSELPSPLAPFGPLTGTGVYTVSVAWQGLVDSAAPADNCANNLYGTETKRRTLSVSFRLGRLN
ncbi:MAG TPA: type IV pilus modification protein PilV [Burkholderiales bacterium]|nr:type IV pilus modification protein PilV [Burkholderiales bacterium]